MRRTLTTLIALLLVACGGADAGTTQASTATGNATPETTAPANSAATGGAVENKQPAGQATASVDGLEFTLTESPALTCAITDEAITFAFWIGDNEVTLGGGANLYDTGWLGAVTLTVANPDGEAGPITYYPDLAANGSTIAIDGSSMSYSGPMLKQPANDGSQPPPVDAGEGTFSVTCG